MCGIASFLSNNKWLDKPDTDWLFTLETAFDDIRNTNDLLEAAVPMATLADHFYELMAFGLHLLLVADPETRRAVTAIRDTIRSLRNAAAVKLEQGPRTDELEALRETLDDYLWQIDQEVLTNADRTLALMPEALSRNTDARDRQFLAWGTEQVLQAIDKLEVRGRDSAGVAVAFILPKGTDPELTLTKDRRRNCATAAPSATPIPVRYSCANCPTAGPPAASSTRWHNWWANSETTAAPCATSSGTTNFSGPCPRDWKP